MAVVIAAEEKKTQKQVSLGIHKFDVDALKEKVRWNVLYEKKTQNNLSNLSSKQF